MNTNKNLLVESMQKMDISLMANIANGSHHELIFAFGVFLFCFFKALFTCFKNKE